MSYTAQYLAETAAILDRLPVSEIEALVDALCSLRDRGGRLFIVGVGGGAGHASHAACDFRRSARIEAYAPMDNVSELSARVNDDGWERTLAGTLEVSRFNALDALLVFSVGGGDSTRGVSTNLVRAMDYARAAGAMVLAVVGRDGGHAARVADRCVIVPVVNPATVTPHTETFQALIWHLLVSHPRLQTVPMRWESVAAMPT
jgi:D-sedoheptulose 7-phosphate isomerase